MDQLCAAAVRGQVEIVKALLSEGETVPDEALLGAAENGHADVVRWLLDHGANMQARRPDSTEPYGGVNAFDLAVIHGHLATVEVLLDRGTDASDSFLATAAINGHMDVVRRLLDHGAQVEEDDLLLLCLKGCADALTLVLQRREFTEMGKSDALRYAAVEGHDKVVQVLLEHGANVQEAFESDELSALMDKNHAKTLALLLRHGVTVEDPDEVLLWAAHEGHREVAALLLQVPPVPPGTEAKNHALQRASDMGHREVVALLLNAGADVHAPLPVREQHAERDEKEDPAGRDAALLLAAWRGHREVVHLLLDRGADLHAQKDRALRLALQFDHARMVEELLERGDYRMANLAAVYAWVMRDVRYLLSMREGKTASRTCAAIRDAILRLCRRTVAAYRIQAAWKRARYQADTYLLGRRYAAAHVAEILGGVHTKT